MPVDEKDQGLDTAWRVHDALSTWTGRVDAKASIILTLEVAALGFVVTLTAKDRVFAELDGFREGAFLCGAVLLVIAILAAVGAVIPQLRPRKTDAAVSRGQFVYFGHLRHWQPGDLATHLGDLSSKQMKQVLADQLVAMAKIAWLKHRCLQVSVLSGLVAGIGFGVAGLG